MQRLISFLYALVGGNSKHFFSKKHTAIFRWYGPFYPEAEAVEQVMRQSGWEYTEYSVTFRSTSWGAFLEAQQRASEVMGSRSER